MANRTLHDHSVSSYGQDKDFEQSAVDSVRVQGPGSRLNVGYADGKLERISSVIKVERQYCEWI
jgi:hypothetical protein